MMSEEKQVKTKAEVAMIDEVTAIAEKATDDDRATANAIAESQDIRYENVTPCVAAVLFVERNRFNRQLSVEKVRTFAPAMDRGEWRRNHQGIAFYPDGVLADGQNRLASVALTKQVASVPLLVVPDFDRDAIDTIDRSKGRTASEALTMRGVANAKPKASAAKAAMDYTDLLNAGQKRRLTDQQIEAFVMRHNALLDKAVDLGARSVLNIDRIAMSDKDATQIAFLMLLGDWPESMVAAFLASIQQGIASYPQSPTLELSRQLSTARTSDRKRYRLRPVQKLALSLKCATLWVEQKAVSRLTWSDKEPLPSNSMPNDGPSAVAAG